MDDFFQKLSSSAMDSLLSWMGAEDGIFLLLDGNGLVCDQNWASTVALGDLLMQPFAQLLTARCARMFRLTLREHMPANLYETIDGIPYTLLLKPVDTHMLLRMVRTETETTDAHALGVRPEARLTQQLSQLLQLTTQVQPDADTLLEVRRLGMQMHREILHASLLREGHSLYGTVGMVDLTTLCRQVINNISYRTTCILELHGDLVTCMCNSQSMEMILYNVIANAVQARNVSRVDVTLEQLGDDVHMIVRDNGNPISLATPTGALAKAYTGMGLAVSKKLLAEQNGVLNLDVTPNGSTCHLWFSPAPLPDPTALHQPTVELGNDISEIMLSIL